MCDSERNSAVGSDVMLYVYDVTRPLSQGKKVRERVNDRMKGIYVNRYRGSKRERKKIKSLREGYIDRDKRERNRGSDVMLYVNDVTRPLSQGEKVRDRKRDT